MSNDCWFHLVEFELAAGQALINLVHFAVDFADFTAVSRNAMP